MGAGLAGVTTAWYLARDGHEVVVLDREREVGAAATSANTGIIAASRAYPWSSGELGRAILRVDPELRVWGIQHLLLGSGRSYRRILDAKVRLVRHSQQALHELAREIGFDGLRRGVLYLYREAGALDTTRLAAALYAPGGEAFVRALGVMDRRLREQLGTAVPLVRPEAAPRHAAIDESRRVSCCPIGAELRITGGAEFAGYAMSSEPHDFAPLYDVVKQLYPGAVDYARARTRACQRPMTPETTPRFGTGKYQNLWFNIGHGHMGFTMAAGGGQITADLVAGRTPAIDLEGLRIRRH